MKNLSEKLDKQTLENVMSQGAKALNGQIDFDSLSTAEIKDLLAYVTIYQELLKERFTPVIDKLTNLIPDNLFNDTLNVDKLKVKLELKEVINAKAIGLTNAELKPKYGIADAIISEDTKTIVTLHKDQLDQAVNAQITEVLDAIKDGALTFSKDNTKTISVK